MSTPEEITQQDLAEQTLMARAAHQVCEDATLGADQPEEPFACEDFGGFA